MNRGPGRKMNRKHILVIGDTIIDHTVYGEAIGLSLETPTIKGKYDKEDYTFGGASNVVNNLLALGQNVTFITPVSQSKYGNLLRNWSEDNFRIVCLDSDQENFVKSRYWLARGDSYYKVLQMNRGTPALIDDTQHKKIVAIIKNNQIDLVVLVDYGGGVFDDPDQIKNIIGVCRDKGIKVISSSQVSDNDSRHTYFKGSHLICMNEKEALESNPYFEPNKFQMDRLFHLLNSEICVTLGSKGAAYFDGENVSIHAAHPVEPIDTCGAGDSFLAALCSRIENMDIDFSNEWAAMSTLERGIVVPTKENNEQN